MNLMLIGKVTCPFIWLLYIYSFHWLLLVSPCFTRALSVSISLFLALVDYRCSSHILEKYRPYLHLFKGHIHSDHCTITIISDTTRSQHDTAPHR